MPHNVSQQRYILTPLKVWIYIIFQQENKTTTNKQKQESNSHIISSLKCPDASILLPLLQQKRAPQQRGLLCEWL